MASRKELLGKVYKMIPPMLESFHKGEKHWHCRMSPPDENSSIALPIDHYHVNNTLFFKH